MRALLALAVAVAAAALAGCTTTPPPGSPLPLAGPEFDLRGTWTGTWGSGPVELVVVEQHDSQPYSGLFFGPVMVLGRAQPGLAGVLTYTVRDAPTSVRVVGWLGGSAQSPTLRLEGEAIDGTVYAALRRLEPGRFVGMGQSTFPWGPQGPIELVRRPTS
jgi:hypothetical protein